MSESKFTPGPWFAKREGFSTVYVETRLRHGVIQEVAACGPTEAGQAQQEANARLIATAPDLLSIVQRFVALDAQWHPDLYATEKAELMAEARAAVTKAIS